MKPNNHERSLTVGVVAGCAIAANVDQRDIQPPFDHSTILKAHSK